MQKIEKTIICLQFAILCIVCSGKGIAAVYAAGAESSASPAAEMSLDQFVKTAMQKNPGLMEKKARYESLRSKVIGAWLPDDPEIGTTVEGQSHLFDFNSRMDLKYMAEQKIPFPTKLFLKGLAASKEADGAYQEYKEEERNLVWHMEKPYYELLLARSTSRVLEENKVLLDQLIKAVKARYESNQSPQSDLLKAQIELSKNELEMFDWKQKEHIAEAHFSHLLNQSLNTRYAISEKIDKTTFIAKYEELEATAIKNRPELKALDIAIERAKVNRSLINSEWLPDFTARYESKQFKGEGSIREHDTFIGVTVPFWSVLKGIGGVWTSSDREVKEAEALYIKMKNEVFLAIHEAYAKAQSAQNAISIFENSILPQAKQQVEVALSSYEAGKSDFMSLIDAERTLKETQIRFYRYSTELQIALSELRFVLGGDIKEIVEVL